MEQFVLKETLISTAKVDSIMLQNSALNTTDYQKEWMTGL